MAEAAAYREAARRSLDEWAPEDVAPLNELEDAKQETLRNGGEARPPDDVLRELWRIQGFDGFPTVGGPQVVDDVVAQGGIELWRGLRGSTAAELAEQYRTGDAYAGVGVNGNGTYTGVRRSTGEGFATSSSGGEGGALMRMALRPDARIIERRALDELIGEQMRAVREAEGVKWGYPMTGAKRALFNDPGRFATAMGYDAIYVDRSTQERAGAAWSQDEGGDDSHYVVLNRSALAVQDTDPRFG